MTPMPIACEYPQGSCGFLQVIGCLWASARPLGGHRREIALPWGLALMLATIRRRALASGDDRPYLRPCDPEQMNGSATEEVSFSDL